MLHLRSFILISSQFFLLVFFCCVLASDNPLTHKPCEHDRFYQARDAPTDNRWRGRLYMDDFSFTSSVKLIVKVDKASRIEVEDREGQITGPNTGRMFRISYYGTPQNVSYIDFSVKPVNSKEFSNLISLEVNSQNACRNPKPVRFKNFL